MLLELELRCRGRLEVPDETAGDYDRLLATGREGGNVWPNSGQVPELVLEWTVLGMVVFSERYGGIACVDLDPRMSAVDVARFLLLHHEQDSELWSEVTGIKVFDDSKSWCAAGVDFQCMPFQPIAALHRELVSPLHAARG